MSADEGLSLGLVRFFLDRTLPSLLHIGKA